MKVDCEPPMAGYFPVSGLRLSDLCWNLHSVPLRMQKDCTVASTTSNLRILQVSFHQQSMTTAAANACQSWLNTISSVQQHPTRLLAMFQHFELGFSFCLVTSVLLSSPEAPHTKVEAAAVKGAFGTKGSEWHSCLRSTPWFPVRSSRN